MRILATVLSLAIGLGASSLVQAAETVTVSAGFAGEAPRKMTVTTDDDIANLALDATTGLFRGPVSLNRRINDVDLVIDYPDSTQFTLPLRLSAGTPRVAVAVKRPSEVRCTIQVLNQLGVRAGALQEAVQKYLAAKAINEISGLDRCGSGLRKLATKTWFDASYVLVTMKPFFRLDPGAYAAYAAFDRQRATIYQRQANAAHTGAMYQQSLALFAAGHAADALQVNSDLKTALEGDAALAKATQELQGVTAARLVADSALFESRILEEPAV